jgi:hypothetical protein
MVIPGRHVRTLFIGRFVVDVDAEEGVIFALGLSDVLKSELGHHNEGDLIEG